MKQTSELKKNTSEVAKEIIEATSYWYLSGMSRDNDKTTRLAIGEVEVLLEEYKTDIKNNILDYIESRENLMSATGTGNDAISAELEDISDFIKHLLKISRIDKNYE